MFVEKRMNIGMLNLIILRKEKQGMGNCLCTGNRVETTNCCLTSNG